MNPSKIQDFSNPYSRKNKKIMAHINKRIFSGSPQLTFNPHNRSMNPDTSISHFPDAGQYKKVSKIALSKDRIDKIKYSLSIDQTSRSEYEKRMLKGNFFFKYQQTPTDPRKTQERQPFQKVRSQMDQGRQKLSNKQIVQALKVLKQTNNLQSLKERIDKTQFNMVQMINRMHNIMVPQPQIKVSVQTVQQEEQIDVSVHLVSILQNDALEELDFIVGVKEESFFQKKLQNKKINIFKFLFNPGDSDFMSGHQHLKKHHFCFDSINSFTHKRFNQEIYYSLSTYSRITAINNTSKTIPKEFKVTQSELIMDPELITFQNIMLLAKGLVRPSVLNSIRQKFQRGIQEMQDTSLIQITHNIDYNDNTNQRSTNCSYKNVQKSEQIYYKEVEMTRKEKLEVKRIQGYSDRMKDILKRQQFIKKNYIHDRSIHQRLKKQKQAILKQQLTSRTKVVKTMEMEKKIRAHKLKKDKTQNIRIDALCDNMKNKKLTEVNFKQKSRSRSKASIPKVMRV